MKKVLCLLIVALLLLPITVFAKTPTLEETLNVIRDISNVTVIDGVVIESTRVDESNVYFTINGQEECVPYEFADNTFTFYGGHAMLDGNGKVDGEIFDNAFAFFLYSILENKSAIPYDFNTYYSTDNIKELIDNQFATEYKEGTNTFGISLRKEEGYNPVRYQIIYHYYLNGDYPVFDLAGETSEFVNPATGNYNILITIMLVSVLCIGIYSYVNREKKGN